METITKAVSYLIGLAVFTGSILFMAAVGVGYWLYWWPELTLIAGGVATAAAVSKAESLVKRELPWLIKAAVVVSGAYATWYLTLSIISHFR